MVRKDLSPSQRIVQSAHACIEATKAFIDPNLEHPHLIVLAVDNESQLLKAASKIEAIGVKHSVFIEPDMNNQATALATEPVFGEKRKFFRRFQLV